MIGRQLGEFQDVEVLVYLPAFEAISELIDGFESPLGTELVATADWLISVQEGVKP